MEGSLGAGQVTVTDAKAGQVTVTDAKGSNGPPGADQHPAGSSRAAGRDMPAGDAHCKEALDRV